VVCCAARESLQGALQKPLHEWETGDSTPSFGVRQERPPKEIGKSAFCTLLCLGLGGVQEENWFFKFFSFILVALRIVHVTQALYH
jgi:hypothetical protein